MTDSAVPASIRSQALQLAASDSWHAVAGLLAPFADEVMCDGELALLYAESRMRSGEERAASHFLPAVIALLADGADRRAHRRAINMLGAARLAIGDLAEAARLFSEVLELAREADDHLMLAQASNNLGEIANLRGDHQLALWHYRIALPMLQRLGQGRRIAESYHNIAITCRDLGELEEADEHERRAIDYAADAKAARVAAMGRVGRAEIALRRGDAPFAEITASLAADEFANLADPLNESDARRLVGAARVARGLADDALIAFEQSLTIAESRGHTFNQAEALRDRVEAWSLRGESAQARADARHAISLFSSLGATAEVARLEKRLASLG